MWTPTSPGDCPRARGAASIVEFRLSERRHLRALGSFEKTLAYGRNVQSLWVGGYSAAGIGDYALALEWLTQAIRFSPGDPEVHFTRAHIAERAGNEEMAIADSKRSWCSIRTTRWRWRALVLRAQTRAACHSALKVDIEKQTNHLAAARAAAERFLETSDRNDPNQVGAIEPVRAWLKETGG